jgi:predicted RNase H-like HicB family nuclease
LNLYSPKEHRYPVQISFISDGYYFVFLPDFGASACSATGDTLDEALELLTGVLADITDYYREAGTPVPEPFSKAYNPVPS